MTLRTVIMPETIGAPAIVETDIPARLDRLPWSRFHTLVVAALGITWILDGLEVTLAGSVAGALKASPVLHFSNAEVGLAASAYLAGAVLGALFFGWLTDRLGRKKLFFITLAVYLVRHGGDRVVVEFLELRAVPLPDRRRHRRRIRRDQLDHPGTHSGARCAAGTISSINGSFWIGRGARRARRNRAARSGVVIDPEFGWRAGFGIGAALALVIFLMRLWLPESPRWLMTHGRAGRGRARGRAASSAASLHVATLPPPAACRGCGCARARHTPLSARSCTRSFRRHRRRTLVGLALMVAQAFFYNAIFFTYALVLTDFYGIPLEQRRLVHSAVRRREISSGRCCSAGCSTCIGRRRRPSTATAARMASGALDQEAVNDTAKLMMHRLIARRLASDPSLVERARVSQRREISERFSESDVRAGMGRSFGASSGPAQNLDNEPTSRDEAASAVIAFRDR